MTYPHTTATIICDSVTSAGSRLTTFELTYPRYIHAELMTHRQFSRNAQSSRAVPVEKRLSRVRENPVMPIRWGANQRGMQAKDDDVEQPFMCEAYWRHAAEAASQAVCKLLGENLHKQWCNRLLEPFDTITTIVTASQWNNFFGLRCHPDAQPEFQYLAWIMADLYFYHQYPELHDTTLKDVKAPMKPDRLDVGQWHLPYVKTAEYINGDFKLTDLVKFSVARCARVSYLTHDGENPDPAKDIALHDRLLADGHMSPFEHQAFNAPMQAHSGNFGPGWVQYRKTLTKELRTFDYLEALKGRK
jgi:thymidylate synthase ThyX